MSTAIWENYDPDLHPFVKECLDRHDLDGSPWPDCFVIGTIIIESGFGAACKASFNFPIIVNQESNSDDSIEEQIEFGIRTKLIPSMLRAAQTQSFRWEVL